MSQLLSTSPSLEEAKKMIAEFYCTTADRITLTVTENIGPTSWSIKVGNREIKQAYVVLKKSRFQFRGV